VNTKVDKFLQKSDQWKDELTHLRPILLETKLEEDLKWNLPCYTYQGKNIAIIQPFKSCLALMFFKGSLLKDPKKLLIANGPHSQAARRFEFRSVKEISKLRATIKSYIKEAMAIEEAGEKVEFQKTPHSEPAELQETFARNAKLKKAFQSLTPGRQRAYLMHFSNAKQSATRLSRIKKCIPQILEGKGLDGR
jgi:uncharacterized protein YdeI (YjbR/CyaY-like superfamily)